MNFEISGNYNIAKLIINSKNSRIKKNQNAETQNAETSVEVYPDGNTDVYFAFSKQHPTNPDAIGYITIPENSQSEIGNIIVSYWNTVDDAKSNATPIISDKLDAVYYEDFSIISESATAAALPGTENPSMQPKTYAILVTNELYGPMIYFIRMTDLRVWFIVTNFQFVDHTITLTSLIGYDDIRPPELEVAEYVTEIYKNIDSDELLSEGAFVTNGILYYTRAIGTSTAEINNDEGIYIRNIDLSDSEPIKIITDTVPNARWNGLELISSDNNVVKFFAANWKEPGGLYVIEHSNSSTTVTEVITKINNVNVGAINDIVLENAVNKGVFCTDSSLNKIYYRSDIVNPMTVIDLSDMAPNGITCVKENDIVTGLYISISNRGKIIYVPITWNNNSPVSGTIQEPEWGRLKSTGFGGDGLIYLNNLIVDNTSFGPAIISAHNNSYMGVLIYLFNINERLFIDVPFNSLNIALYNDRLIVLCRTGILNIDLKKMMNRSLLLKNDSMSNLGSNLKPKVIMQGVKGVRNMIVNKQNDILAIVPDTGLVLYRVNWNDNNILFGDEGIIIIDNPNLNHGLAARTINNISYLFVSTENEVYSYVYDDSSLTKASQKLNTSSTIITNINAGTVTTLEREPGGGNHKTRELCFDTNGNLYVQTGSAGNVDIDASRSMVRRCTASTLEMLLTDNSSVSYSNLDPWAIGLRNAVGLTCAPDGTIECVNMGADNIEKPSNVTDPPYMVGEVPFSDEQPTDSFYRLTEERVSKKYGYPYMWLSGTELIQDGVTKPINTNFSETRGLGDSSPIPNPYDDTAVRTDPFIQGCDVPLGAHVAPIAITYNYDNGNCKITYDGKCNQNLTKTKIIPENFALISFKGSWNKTVPAGNMIASMKDDQVLPFYYNNSFSSGSTTSFSTNSRYTFRPTGICIDLEGRILIATQPRPGYQHGSIIAITPSN